MVNPASLWSLFKNCRDSKWLGDICRALGRQEVELDYGQRMVLSQIQDDSKWMDERIEEQKKRWAERQRKSRKSRDVTQCHGDNGESRDVTQCHADECDNDDVTIPPSLPPSLTNNNTLASVNTRTREKDGRPSCVPTDEEARRMAKEINVPIVYLPKFFEDMENHGWAYINRGGATVHLNRKNFKAILRSFYEVAKSKKQKGGEPAAPMQTTELPAFKEVM